MREWQKKMRTNHWIRKISANAEFHLNISVWMMLFFSSITLAIKSETEFAFSKPIWFIHSLACWAMCVGQRDWMFEYWQPKVNTFHDFDRIHRYHSVFFYDWFFVLTHTHKYEKSHFKWNATVFICAHLVVAFFPRITFQVSVWKCCRRRQWKREPNNKLILIIWVSCFILCARFVFACVWK